MDCLQAQQAAVIRGDLAEVQRHADRFDGILDDLGPGAFTGAAGDPEVAALLQAVVREHRRLRTGVGLLREEVAQQLRQVRRGQPAVSAYGRQVSAAAGAAAAAAAPAGGGAVTPAANREGAGPC